MRINVSKAVGVGRPPYRTHLPSNPTVNAIFRAFDLYFDLEDDTCSQYHLAMTWRVLLDGILHFRIDAVVSETRLSEISALEPIVGMH